MWTLKKEYYVRFVNTKKNEYREHRQHSREIIIDRIGHRKVKKKTLIKTVELYNIDNSWMRKTFTIFYKTSHILKLYKL